MTRRVLRGGKGVGATTGSRFGRHVTAVMAEKPLSFTLESETVQDPAWRKDLDELVALAGDCDRISITRTPGAVRKAARGRSPEREAPTAVLDNPETSPDTFQFDLARLQGGTRPGAPSDADRADEIAQILAGHPPSRMSRAKRAGIDQLATHAREHRDVFVSTDGDTLAKREGLAAVGIRVEDPPAALSLARERCVG